MNESGSIEVLPQSFEALIEQYEFNTADDIGRMGNEQITTYLAINSIINPHDENSLKEWVGNNYGFGTSRDRSINAMKHKPSVDEIVSRREYLAKTYRSDMHRWLSNKVAKQSDTANHTGEYPDALEIHGRFVAFPQPSEHENSTAMNKALDDANFFQKQIEELSPFFNL